MLCHCPFRHHSKVGGHCAVAGTQQTSPENFTRSSITLIWAGLPGSHRPSPDPFPCAREGSGTMRQAGQPVSQRTNQTFYPGQQSSAGALLHHQSLVRQSICVANSLNLMLHKSFDQDPTLEYIGVNSSKIITNFSYITYTAAKEQLCQIQQLVAGENTHY